jgi:hypothetical protein
MSEDVVESLMELAVERASYRGIPIEITPEHKAATAIASLREERDKLSAHADFLASEMAEDAETIKEHAERIRSVEADNASLRERVRVLEGALRQIITSDTRLQGVTSEDAIEVEGGFADMARKALNEQLARPTKV